MNTKLKHISEVAPSREPDPELAEALELDRVVTSGTPTERYNLLATDTRREYYRLRRAALYAPTDELHDQYQAEARELKQDHEGYIDMGDESLTAARIGELTDGYAAKFNIPLEGALFEVTYEVPPGHDSTPHIRRILSGEELLDSNVVELFADMSPTAPASADVAPQPANVLAFRTLHEVLTNPTKVEWLIDDEIERDVIALLAGPPGSFKSFLAIDWAMRTAARGEPVFMFTAEGNDFDRRAEAWLRTFAPGADSKTLPLYAFERRLDISASDVRASIVETARQLGARPALTIIDTFSKYSGALDENSNTDVKAFVTGLDSVRRAIGGTVLLVAHTGHTDKSRARGAMALTADTDAAYIANKKGDRVHVSRERLKSTGSMEPIVLAKELIDLGEGRDSLVLRRETYTPGTSNGRKPSPRQLEAYSTYQDLRFGRERVPFGEVVDALAPKLPFDPEKRDNRRGNAGKYVREMVDAFGLRIEDNEICEAADNE